MMSKNKNKNYDIIAELRSENVRRYVEEEVTQRIESNNNNDCIYEYVKFRKEKTASMFTFIFNEYKHTINECNNNKNFGVYIDSLINFLQFDIYRKKWIREGYESILKVKDGEYEPWDIEPEYILKLAFLLGIPFDKLVEKLKVHPTSAADKDIKYSVGLCARAEKDLSDKKREDAMNDAVLLMFKKSKSNKIDEYIKILENTKFTLDSEYSMPFDYCFDKSTGKE